MKSRKAQITIFIIIGIVLLLSTALILYIRNTITEQRISAIEGTIETVPAQIEPIQVYIRACVEQTAEEAIKTAMEHGGYTDTSDLIAMPTMETEGNAIEYFPDSGYKIPYWNYLKSPNEVMAGAEFDSKMPALCKPKSGCITNGENSIEEQIEIYVNSNLDGCLNDFPEFRQQGFDFETETIKTSVFVRENDVVVNVNYPIKVKKDDFERLISTFPSTINVPLRELYEVAYKIRDYEIKNCFIGKHVENKRSFHEGLSSKKLPPTSINTFGERSSPIWILIDVKERMKPIIMDAMKKVNVFNTSGFVYPIIDEGKPYYKLRQGIAEQNIFQAVDEFYGVEINFEYYPWWDIYFDIKPSEGGVLGPTLELDMSSGDSFIMMLLNKLLPKTYEYYYMYSFPVIIEIRKEDELEKLHLFRFALEENIRANRCFIEGASIQKGVQGMKNPLLCDLDEREDKNITITVKDEYNESKLMGGVDVNYYAGFDCKLGTTNSSGKLITSLPSGVFGALLTFRKDGYLQKRIHQKDFSFPMNIEMKPIFKKKVKIAILNETVLDEIISTISSREAYKIKRTKNRPATPNNTITLQITRVSDDYMDGKVENIVIWSKGEFTGDIIDLVPGEYEISGQIISYGNFSLPEEHDRICVDCDKVPVDPGCSPRGSSRKAYKEGNCYIWGYTCTCPITGSDICCDVNEPIDYPQVNMSTIPSGGVEINNQSYYWRIPDYSFLNDDKNLTIYLFKHNAPTRHHHMEDLTKYINYSIDYRMYIEPEWE